jgi:UDP-2,3-diacylglucosamine pyrophosphatase LpxH
MSQLLHQSPDDGFNYIMLSDVHLGSDIIPHVRPWASTSWLLEKHEIDARLVGWLNHYAAHRDQGRPWRLVIAGDFLDLAGVSLTTPAGMRTAPTAEEQRHGLGSAVDHVLHKVEAIVARHPTVFHALGRFVAAGNALVFVRGNHDIELHWNEAQNALVSAMLALEPVEEHDALRSRIAIRPWFFAVEGLLYVEHGHEFDPLCGYGDPLSSTCMRDPRRIRCTAFSVLLRYVARPTRGLSSGSYSYAGMGDYVRLLLKLGWRGSLAIAGRYLRASYHLLAECVLNTSSVARERARAAALGLAQFAHVSGVSEERLEHLRALHVTPAVQRFGVMLRSLYLDRIVCALVGTLGLVLAAPFFAKLGVVGSLSIALVAALSIGYALVGSGDNCSPQATMLHNAAHIAKLFSARWVVMGHTHQPIMQPVSASASYVNLGSWGEDDPPDERTVSRDPLGTFLVLRKRTDDFLAELLRWDEQHGPMLIEPASYSGGYS